MKPLKSPEYASQPDKRIYHHSHSVPGFGMCPVCGQFGRVDGNYISGEFKTQYRVCPDGHRFQSVVRVAD